MNLYVVDACVAIKWFVLEIHNEAALRLRHSAYHLHVPNFFLLEFGNVISKKYRRGEITLAESHFMINKVQSVSFTWHEDKLLFPKAFEIANETHRSFYDCLYLSLAVSLDGQMVTADSRFYEALKNSHYGNQLLWVEDIP